MENKNNFDEVASSSHLDEDITIDYSEDSDFLKTASADLKEEAVEEVVNYNKIQFPRRRSERLQLKRAKQESLKVQQKNSKPDKNLVSITKNRRRVKTAQEKVKNGLPNDAQEEQKKMYTVNQGGITLKCCLESKKSVSKWEISGLLKELQKKMHLDCTKQSRKQFGKDSTEEFVENSREECAQNSREECAQNSREECVQNSREECVKNRIAEFEENSTEEFTDHLKSEKVHTSLFKKLQKEIYENEIGLNNFVIVDVKVEF